MRTLRRLCPTTSPSRSSTAVGGPAELVHLADQIARQQVASLPARSPTSAGSSSGGSRSSWSAVQLAQVEHLADYLAELAQLVAGPHLNSCTKRLERNSLPDHSLHKCAYGPGVGGFVKLTPCGLHNGLREVGWEVGSVDCGTDWGGRHDRWPGARQL